MNASTARLVFLLLIVSWIASAAATQPRPITSLTNAEVAFTVPSGGYAVLKREELEVVVVDNRAVDNEVLPGHAAGYHGIASIKHSKQPRNLFVPSYSGLNFEHIHDGTTRARDNLFEPRRASMELRLIGENTVELHQKPTPHWGLESCMRYELLPGGVIEMTFECIPRVESFTNGYCGLFWASYINRPESFDIHFRGSTEPRLDRQGWIRGITPFHGMFATHRGLDDKRIFPHEPAFPLELPFGFSRHRFSEPWFFGIYRGMAFVQMFRAADQVWLSQSPSGGGQDCPAWDFQWYIQKPQVGQLYQMRMRAAYLPLDNPTDIESIRSQVLGAVAGMRLE